MSDTGDAGAVFDAAAGAATEAASAADTGAPAAPADAGGGEPDSGVNLDIEIPRGINSFDRQYVEKLRGEAAKYRTQAREAQGQVETMQGRYQVFDEYTDADLDVWRNLATSWSTDPRAAAETMRTISVNVLGDPNATTEEKVEAAQDIQQLDQAQSPEQVQQMIDQKLAEHDRQQQLQAQVSGIESKLTDAGYAKGTMPYSSVLWYATNDPTTEGNIDKAIERFHEYRQTIVDEYVTSIRDGKVAPRGPQTSQPATAAPEAPTSIGEATDRARQFLADRGRHG